MSKTQVSCIKYLHEAAFAANLAFSLVAFLFLLDFRSATSALFRMNVAIYRRLHLLPDLKVPKDSYTGEYFAFFVPALALAVCLWLLLRVCSRANFIRGSLRSIAGITAVVAPPVWWLCFAYGANRRYGWTPFAATQFYEVVVILALVMLYLVRNRFNFQWAATAILVLHYGFWFWQFGPHPFFMGYGGPTAPTAGLCASLAWLLYLAEVYCEGPKQEYK